MVNGAVRFENYSDFGNTLNYKLATRYKIAPNFNLRVLLQPDLERHPYTKFILIIRLLNLLEVSLCRLLRLIMTKKSYPSQIIWNSTIKTRGISERQHWFYCKNSVGKS
jgi:hypothetical protein